VNYGLTTQLTTHHPVRVAFHEYVALAHDVKSAHGLKTKTQVLLWGPGWTPPAEPSVPAPAGAEPMPRGRY